jgi:hypothetical protein
VRPDGGSALPAQEAVPAAARCRPTGAHSCPSRRRRSTGDHVERARPRRDTPKRTPEINKFRFEAPHRPPTMRAPSLLDQEWEASLSSGLVSLLIARMPDIGGINIWRASRRTKSYIAMPQTAQHSYDQTDRLAARACVNQLCRNRHERPSDFSRSPASCAYVGVGSKSNSRHGIELGRSLRCYDLELEILPVLRTDGDRQMAFHYSLGHGLPAWLFHKSRYRSIKHTRA